jgi:hypothetical protein
MLASPIQKIFYLQYVVVELFMVQFDVSTQVSHYTSLSLAIVSVVSMLEWD